MTWFKNAFRKCPNLDVPKLAQIYLFYNGPRVEFRNIVDAFAGGSILTIEVDDAHNLFERIAENQANWLTDRKAPRKISGLHNVDAVTALAAQMEAITKKLDTLNQFVHMVQHPAPVCAGCGDRSHHFKLSFGFYSHRSVSRGQLCAELLEMKGNPPVIQQQQGKRQSLEDLLVTYITKIETPTAKQVQAITTRSGVQLPEITVKRKQTKRTQMPTKDKEPMKQSGEAIEKDQQTVSDNPQLKANVPGTSLKPLVPFPQTLQKTKLEKQAMKFLKILKKLHVNITFIDVILQILSYSKFLKEMLTKKRKMPEHETIILPEGYSVIIQHRIPPKHKDPGGFTLPFSIGNLQGINCLIDSGASINLIPLPLYRKLGLGDPKAASIILQLADRTLKHPYGIVEDILIKMGGFIFPANFTF
ncbi:uncharacterized protein LOC111404422 [Olea europaea var. sylvestris]|uniref:uncharacterized protein LOC111404422 n=1 Tax=Olea europaea var. sylvestris TaxID=158386 RepID=UPI000C1CE264|nr:uncharacterized protein LOC111404422 [Olea europaea var. sylvestris]